MLPAAIYNLFRISGIVVTAMLIISPWFLATFSSDPFLNQSWIVFSLAAMAICILAVVFLFFRPRNGHFAFFKPLLLIYIAITSSLFFSDFMVSLRVSLLWCSLLLLLAFLRLSRRQTDNFGIAMMVSFAGTIMAIYSLMQKSGIDFFNWSGSPYKMVGTLSNPNFLAAYLMLTAVFTLGLAIEGSFNRNRNRAILLIMFLVQSVAVFMTNSLGAILGLILGLILFFTKFWEVKPGRVLRFSPFLSGAIIAIVLTLLQGIVFYSTTNYPWENLSTPPYKYLSVVSRLVVWQMGFAVFLSQPVSGLGPGAIKYLMPAQRPPFGTALGIKLFNDDPHSAVVSLLGETGILGLFAFSTLFCYLVGIYIWRRSKGSKLCENENEIKAAVLDPEKPEAESNVEGFELSRAHWLPAIIPALLVALAFKAGFINLPILFYSIPLIILFMGIYNTLQQSPIVGKNTQPIMKTPLVAILVFVFHSSFNNNITVTPLLSLIVVMSSLLMSNSLRDVAWKKKFSLASIPYLCLPLLFVFTAYNLQGAYQNEQLKLYAGKSLLEKGNFPEAQKAFETAIRSNPQSLKAYFGLAMALKEQDLLDDAQDILEKLDRMVPNAFNANYELARILLKRRHILEAHKYALKGLKWNLTPTTYELLGRIILTEGKISEAEKIFKEGLLLVPDQDRQERLAADRIRLNLAALAANSSRFEECEKYLSMVKSSISEASEALYLKGMLLSQKGKQKEALELFEKALIQSPENHRIMNAVGFLLVKGGKNLDRAQVLLETAHQIVKTSEAPLLSDLLMVAHSLGTLYWTQGKPIEACKLLEISWEQCPDAWKSVKEGRLEDLKRFYQETSNLEGLKELQNKTASHTEAITPDLKNTTTE